MVTRATESSVEVRFVGGPRDGMTKVYPRDPIVVACASEARERRCPRGLYRTNGALSSEGVLTAVWKPLKVKPVAEEND